MIILNHSYSYTPHIGHKCKFNKKYIFMFLSNLGLLLCCSLSFQRLSMPCGRAGHICVTWFNTITVSLSLVLCYPLIWTISFFTHRNTPPSELAHAHSLNKRHTETFSPTRTPTHMQTQAPRICTYPQLVILHLFTNYSLPTNLLPTLYARAGTHHAHMENKHKHLQSSVF